MENPTSSSPHILMFPLPIQSHVNTMLKLAELFCLANFKVTFLNSAHNHQRMAQFSDIQAHFSRYLGFKFAVIPDGLPSDHPRAGGDWMDELFQGLTSTTEPILREMLFRTGPWAKMERVTCMVIDAVLSFGYDVGTKAEVPVIGFRLISACCIWAYLCIPKLIQDGEMPFDVEDNDKMDQLVHSVPGMQGILRHRDLPSFCRVKDISDPTLQHLIIKSQQMINQAQSIILNTFEDLEGPTLSLIKAQCPRVYSIGPLQAHLKYRLNKEETSNSNLWELDQSCMSWLDQKPNKSVVYVSFGSLTKLTRDQYMEFWAGLVQSNKYFLWVVRPNMIVGNDLNQPNPVELLKGTKDRGLMVGWAPQEEVLAHRAIGGFLTHSGWNSILESIVARVPMICWSYFADQQVNSRFVSEVWKIGLEMKDKCDRMLVEKMVNNLMEERRDELERSMAKISHQAHKSVMKGGSSYCNFDNLVEDIKAMSKKN